MAYERSWFFDPNVLFSPSVAADATKYTVWRLKALLLGETGAPAEGRWTVVGSSDGVTGALDSVDRWGSTFDATKLVQAANGNAHSWMVLKSPVTVVSGQNRYMFLFLSLDSATVNYATVRLVSSSGTGFTAGSATANPTYTTTNATTAVNASSVNGGTTTPLRFHGAVNASGDFYFFMSPTGSGGAAHLAVICALAATPKANDVAPYWAYVRYDTGTGGTVTVANLTDRGNTMPDQFGTGGYVAACAPLTFCYGGTYTPKSWTGVDSVDGSIPDFPIIIGAYSTQFVRGRIPDFGMTPVGTIAPTGSVTLDGQGAVEYVLFYHLIVPMNAAPDLT